MRKKGFFQNFFKEVADNPNREQKWLFFSLLIGVLILWVYVAIPEQEKNAMIYIVMLIVWGFINAFDVLYAKIKQEAFITVNGLGKHVWIALISGILVSVFLLFLGRQALIQPLSIVNPSVLTFFFVVLIAPIVEAQFFRGLIQPAIILTIEPVLKSNLIAGIIATILQSLLFAFFHINIFGASGNWLPYFAFGVLMTLGVYLFRSIAFEYGAHGVNNFFAFLMR